MARTNIEIDNALIARVMERHGLPTKRAAVEFALRRLAGPPLTADALAALEGLGWEGDLETSRTDRPLTP